MTYPSLSFNGVYVISSARYKALDYLSMLWIKLNHDVKWTTGIPRMNPPIVFHVVRVVKPMALISNIPKWGVFIS